MVSRYVMDGIVIGEFLLGILGALFLARGVFAFTGAFGNSRSPYWALVLFESLALLMYEFVSFLFVSFLLGPSASSTVLHQDAGTLVLLVGVCVCLPITIGAAAVVGHERILLTRAVYVAFSLVAIFVCLPLAVDLFAPIMGGQPNWGEDSLFVTLLALLGIVVPSLQHWSARHPIRGNIVLGVSLVMLGIFAGAAPSILQLLGIKVV